MLRWTRPAFGSTEYASFCTTIDLWHFDKIRLDCWILDDQVSHLTRWFNLEISQFSKEFQTFFIFIHQVWVEIVRFEWLFRVVLTIFIFEFVFWCVSTIDRRFTKDGWSLDASIELRREIFYIIYVIKDSCQYSLSESRYRFAIDECCRAETRRGNRKPFEWKNAFAVSCKILLMEYSRDFEILWMINCCCWSTRTLNNALLFANGRRRREWAIFHFFSPRNEVRRDGYFVFHWPENSFA